MQRIEATRFSKQVMPTKLGRDKRKGGKKQDGEKGPQIQQFKDGWQASFLDLCKHASASGNQVSKRVKCQNYFSIKFKFLNCPEAPEKKNKKPLC